MSGIFSGTIEALIINILVNILCGEEAEVPLIPPWEPPWDPALCMETAQLGTLIIETLQEYLCLRSIQALAKHPETLFGGFFLTLTYFLTNCFPLFGPGSSPIIKDARQTLQLDCLKMNNTEIARNRYCNTRQHLLQSQPQRTRTIQTPGENGIS